MWALVTPSARQCGPPELLATLPPIEHVCWLLGSGAKCSPWAATARRQVEVEHARLDPRPAAGRVDAEDAVHLGGRDDDRARPAAPRRRRDRCPTRGRRTARRGATATRHARLDLRRRRREADGDGGALMCEASWRYSDSSVGPSCTRSGASAARSSATIGAGASRAAWSRRSSFTRRAPDGASGSRGPTRRARRRRAPRRRVAGGRRGGRAGRRARPAARARGPGRPGAPRARRRRRGDRCGPTVRAAPRATLAGAIAWRPWPTLRLA